MDASWGGRRRKLEVSVLFRCRCIRETPCVCDRVGCESRGARENTECPIWKTYTKILFIVYLKFKFSWVSCRVYLSFPPFLYITEIFLYIIKEHWLGIQGIHYSLQMYDRCADWGAPLAPERTLHPQADSVRLFPSVPLICQGH